MEEGSTCKNKRKVSNDSEFTLEETTSKRINLHSENFENPNKNIDEVDFSGSQNRSKTKKNNSDKPDSALFVCENCDTKFTRKDNLMRHIRRKH